MSVCVCVSVSVRKLRNFSLLRVRASMPDAVSYKFVHKSMCVCKHRSLTTGCICTKNLGNFSQSLWRAQYVCENIEICVQIGVYVVKVKNFTHHVHIFVST